MTRDGTGTSVDLGQALRGHRFAHRASTAGAATVGDARSADLWAALRAPGLVWSEDGDVTLDATGQDHLVVLALLGRLYPDNVILRPAGNHTGPATVGGNGQSCIVIDCGPRRHRPTGQPAEDTVIASHTRRRRAAGHTRKVSREMIFDHRGDPVRTGRASVNETSLHYRTGGSGPAVVLLHGVPKTSYHWRYLVPKRRRSTRSSCQTFVVSATPPVLHRDTIPRR